MFPIIEVNITSCKSVNVITNSIVFFFFFSLIKMTDRQTDRSNNVTKQRMQLRGVFLLYCSVAGWLTQQMLDAGLSVGVCYSVLEEERMTDSFQLRI